MKSFALLAVLLAACPAAGPQAKPARDLDPKDPKSVAEHAAYNTRSQKSYETKFKAVLTPPQGDSLKYDGQCLWVSPGVLYIHYTASGGDEKNIVRVGSQVWVYHSLVGWVTADEAGMPGAGRGIQNPDEVLGVVARHSGAAKLRQPGLVDMTFSGEDIEKIMREQSQQGAFEWKESSAAVELQADGDHRLKKFVCQATLKPSDAKVGGAVKYSAEVEAVGYNGATELKFLDEKKQEIKLSGDIRKAIDTHLKEKK
jgi:outer membrane lipoprotein-sorting protein